MLRVAADENFNGAIVRGLTRRQPALDLMRIQDAGLSGSNDPDLLAWASDEQRVILTHDVTTLRRLAENRVRAGLPMPGVFEVGEHVSIRDAVEDLLLIAECSREGEWEKQMRFLPLR